MIPSILEEQPAFVCIHAGTNSLPRPNAQHQPAAEEIAREIINIGVTARSMGVQNVAISAITRRRGMFYEPMRCQVNDMLKHMCTVELFSFVDNDNIGLGDLYTDGIHLAESGNIILANNLLRVINNFC